MRISLQSRFTFLLPVLALAVASPAAHATTIDFAGVSSNTTLTTYLENGFTVTSYSAAGYDPFVLNANQGNLKPGLTGGSFTGSDLSGIVLTMTGGGVFDFDSFDISTYTGPSNPANDETNYEVIGKNGASTVYTLGPQDLSTGSPSPTWTTIGVGADAGIQVTSVTILLDTPTGDEDGLDNLVVAPEPSAFTLAGSGMLGLVAFARRRLFA